jgi:UDP-N-acetylmuramate dehydrogenase
VGGASISAAHANFIVSDGHATADDIRTLVELARSRVREQFRVELKDAVVFLGAF